MPTLAPPQSWPVPVLSPISQSRGAPARRREWPVVLAIMVSIIQVLFAVDRSCPRFSLASAWTMATGWAPS